MALKLLQPGKEPAGQFDLKDGVTLYGGEWVNMETVAAGSDLAAADVSLVGPYSGSNLVRFNPGVKTALNTSPTPHTVVFGGLADEGTTGYGTSFGTIIGTAVGKGTGFGAQATSGVITVGPQTTAGSGKVTVWSAPGIYGVSGAPATGSAAPLSAMVVNEAVYSNSSGFLGDSGIVTATSAQVGISLGAVRDSSLVSTTATAAGESAETEFYALYLSAL